MNRATVTTLAKASGASIWFRNAAMATYVFTSEESLLAFREQIPFKSLWGCGLNLNVWFNELAA